MLDIFLAPGEYLVSLFLKIFELYDTDPNIARLFAYVVSFFVWLWSLKITIHVLTKAIKTYADSDGISRGQGPTIGKSLGWLSFVVGAICAVMAAPILFNWLSDPLFHYLSQSINEIVSQVLSVLVIGLLTLALHFLVQSTMHGFLYHAYIKFFS